MSSNDSPKDSRHRTELTKAQSRAVAELMRVAPVIDELGGRFRSAGQDVALVGGSVRDALLGRLGKDLDFTTSARPEQTERILSGWADAVWDLGRAFGTIGARKGDQQIEITTYRADTYEPNSRKPQVSYGDSLEGDLHRRDFTVNAMAFTLPDKRFVDPFGGLDDLARSLLRTPGSPQVSFDDDPLRMIRAARFTAQLGFTVAPEVAEAIRVMAGRIDIVSAERIRDELVKLICGARPRDGLELLVNTGLADRVLPELPALRLEVDEHHRHKDVYEHSLIVLEQSIALEDRIGGDHEPGTPDLVSRLAALLHDIGKPKTRRFEPGGRVTFHHHEMVGAKLARKRMRALKFPGDVLEDVARLIELHLRFHGYGAGEWTDSAVRRYVRDAGPLLDRLHVLTRADCTTRNKRKAAGLQQTYNQLEERIARLAEEEELAAIRPDLDGNEIMEILGIPPGRLVGRARNHLLEVRLDQGPLDKDAARAELLRWWAEQNDPPR